MYAGFSIHSGPPHCPDLQTVCYATIMAIPNFRLKTTDKTEMTFRERPAGQPEALRAWFYPGRQWGEEFVYPKARAMEIATTTKTVSEPITPDAPFVAQMKAAPVMAYQSSGEEVQLAEVVTAPPPAEMQESTATLPQTGSPLPLIALCGLLGMGSAFAMRSIRLVVIRTAKDSTL
jgi:hypothetical protein